MDLYGEDAQTRLLSALIGRLDRRSLVDVSVGRDRPTEDMAVAGVQELHTLEPCPLGPLLDAGEISRRVGMLRVAAERQSFDVVRGMGSLRADVVAVEHWKDLPDGLGPCPWTAQELVAELRPKGYRHFAYLLRHGEFAFLKWDDGEAERGALGSLIFLHEDVLQLLLPALLDCAGWLAERAVRVGQAYMRAWGDRTELITELRRAADDRLALIAELGRTAEERLATIDELKRTADERLALIEELDEIATTRLRALEAAEEQQRSRA
jgi:hypothetical protein